MRSPRALLFAVALAAFGVSGVLLLAAFVVPEAEAGPPRVSIGSVEDYAPNSVTPLVVPEAESGGAWIVRLSDGVLHVFDRRSTHLGCTAAWRDPLNEPGLDAGFKDPCHGSVWRQDGTLYFGPARRDLDRFEFRERPDGEVIVDFGRLTRGAQRPNAPLGRAEVRP